MRRCCSSSFLFVLLLSLSLTRADNHDILNSFGSAYVRGWVGVCNSTNCIMPDDCDWRGTTFGASCEVLDFAPAASLESGVTFPNYLFELTQINSLVISGFDFAGPLVMPATYDYLQFAVPGAALTISWNNFSQTTWPTELNQLSNIASIDFSANRFTGEAPDWWSVGVGGTALVSIDLSYNEFTSLPEVWTTPTTICHFENLRTLKLHDNFFTGPIPAVWQGGTCAESIEEIDLSWNMFESIPFFLISTSLHILNIANNQITGPLPDVSTNVIKELYLQNNLFQGQWPGDWEFHVLEALDISNNNVSGPVPYSAFALSFASLVSLSLASNNFNGTIPPLPDATSTSLYSVDFSSNSFSGPLPTAGWANSSIASYSAAFNKLNGTLPSEIALASSLYDLILNNNEFEGEIPAEWETGRFSSVDLANNRLGGAVPTYALNALIAAWDSHKANSSSSRWWTKFDYFNVSGNNLTGTVPPAPSGYLGLCDFSNNPHLDTSNCVADCVGCVQLCSVTDNCGPVPLVSNFASTTCCDGKWIIRRLVGTLVPPGTTVEFDISIYDNASVYWADDFSQTRNENLTLIYTVKTFPQLKRQAAESLLEVDGNTTLQGGTLTIVLTAEPPQDTDNHTLVAVSTNGQLSGSFGEPINVILEYEGSSCASASAAQETSANSIAVLVSLDRTNCGQRGGGGGGLSPGQKAAIVVCSVLIGGVLLFILAYFLILKFAPDFAVSLGLKRPSTVTIGKLVRR